jgi:hypothetical protein
MEQTSGMHRPAARPDSATTLDRGQEKESRAALSPGGVNAVVLGLWIAFGAALLVDSAGIGDLWDRFRDWPILAQMIVGLFLLPWVVATWVWQTGWADWLRVAIVVVIALVTIGAFAPRRR